MLTYFSGQRLALANTTVARAAGKTENLTMMPLCLADIGEENIIKKIGGSPDVKKHLEDLGFVVGGSVSIVSTLGGKVIVNIKESRVAISEEMARKIMI